MKYFTFELLAAANDWVEQTPAELEAAQRRFNEVNLRYEADLEQLRPRVSRAAWQFFRYGGGARGLHDGRLLSFNAGDGLEYTPEGTRPFRLNRQRTIGQLDFLNYGQQFHYTFRMVGVREVKANLFLDIDSGSGISLGDLYLYELASVDSDNLYLGFLFASGATIEAEFKRLVFRSRRIRRQYDLGDIYK